MTWLLNCPKFHIVKVAVAGLWLSCWQGKPLLDTPVLWWAFLSTDVTCATVTVTTVIRHTIWNQVYFLLSAKKEINSVEWFTNRDPPGMHLEGSRVRRAGTGGRASLEPVKMVVFRFTSVLASTPDPGDSSSKNREVLLLLSTGVWPGMWRHFPVSIWPISTCLPQCSHMCVKELNFLLSQPGSEDVVKN